MRGYCWSGVRFPMALCGGRLLCAGAAVFKADAPVFYAILGCFGCRAMLIGEVKRVPTRMQSWPLAVSPQCYVNQRCFVEAESASTAPANSKTGRASRVWWFPVGSVVVSSGFGTGSWGSYCRAANHSWKVSRFAPIKQRWT